MSAISAPRQGIRTFYTIILTQTLSLIGSKISALAIGIWLYTTTGNATPLALVAFFQMVPQVLLSSFAGVISDRWNRRLIMALSDAGQAIGTVLLLLIFVSGNFEIWHLYLIVVLQSIAGVFQNPALTASVTLLIPDGQRDRANAIMQLAYPASGVIAPALAGFVFALVGIEGALVIDLLTFLVAVAVLLAVHIPQPRKTRKGAENQRGMLADMLTGIRFLWGIKALFWTVMFVALLNLLVSGIGVLFTPYLLARTGSEATMGVLLSLMNAGMLVGGIGASVWGGTRPRIHGAMIGVILMSFFIMGIGLAQSVPALGVALFLALSPNILVNSAFMSIMQTKVPPDLQGRVFATLGQIASMLVPFAYLLAGPLADQVFEPAVQTEAWAALAPFFGSETGAGMGLQIFIYGLLSLIPAVIMYAIPSIRRMEALLPDYVDEPEEDDEAAATEPQTVTAG